MVLVAILTLMFNSSLLFQADYCCKHSNKPEKDNVSINYLKNPTTFVVYTCLQIFTK